MEAGPRLIYMWCAVKRSPGGDAKCCSLSGGVCASSRRLEGLMDVKIVNSSLLYLHFPLHMRYICGKTLMGIIKIGLVQATKLYKGYNMHRREDSFFCILKKSYRTCSYVCISDLAIVLL